MKIEEIFNKIEKLIKSKTQEDIEDKKRELRRALVIKLHNIEEKMKNASAIELKKLEKKKKAITKMYKKVH